MSIVFLAAFAAGVRPPLERQEHFAPEALSLAELGAKASSDTAGGFLGGTFVNELAHAVGSLWGHGLEGPTPPAKPVAVKPASAYESLVQEGKEGNSANATHLAEEWTKVLQDRFGSKPAVEDEQMRRAPSSRSSTLETSALKLPEFHLPRVDSGDQLTEAAEDYAEKIEAAQTTVEPADELFHDWGKKLEKFHETREIKHGLPRITEALLKMGGAEGAPDIEQLVLHPSTSPAPPSADAIIDQWTQKLKKFEDPAPVRDEPAPLKMAELVAGRDLTKENAQVLAELTALPSAAPVHKDRLADVIAAEQAVVAAEDGSSEHADAARFTAHELKAALRPPAAPPAVPAWLKPFAATFGWHASSFLESGAEARDMRTQAQAAPPTGSFLEALRSGGRLSHPARTMVACLLLCGLLFMTSIWRIHVNKRESAVVKIQAMYRGSKFRTELFGELTQRQARAESSGLGE